MRQTSSSRTTHHWGLVRLMTGLLLLSGCASGSTTLSPPTPFTPVPVDFTHTWTKGTHPFTGAAVIDIDGDGTFEIFVGGGAGQRDALLSYRGGRLVNIEPGTGLSNDSTTYGSTAIDLDADGDTDLLVAREDGVFLYLNDRGRFQERRIPVDLPVNSVPFSIAVADIDHDGDGDLYVSLFVNAKAFRSATFNDPTHAKPNRMLLNNGDLTFTDITDSSGTASKQNTFLSVFVDLDSDGWQDLVVAQNTGAVEIFRNMKDRTFQPIAVSSIFGFWMGLAVADIDKDGDQDLFFTNVGTSIPLFLTTGDLRKDQRHTHDWMLLRNDGNFRLTDVTDTYGLSGEGFAWGAVFEDLNLDGQLDLLVAQNYIKWPVHKWLKLSGRTALQSTKYGRPVFQHAPALGLENPYFGQAPVILDLDGDGKQDLLWLNINGPARAFLNTTRANYLTIVVPDTVAAIGTRITLETDNEKSDTRAVIGTVGMLTDQTPELSFGLGDRDRIARVVIQHPNGHTTVIPTPPINSKIRLQ